TVAAALPIAAPRAYEAAQLAVPVAAPEPPAPIVAPEPLPERGHIGTQHAEVTIGDGDDRLSLRITATQNQIRVQAVAATAEMANAMHRGGDELREALARHGLELSDWNAQEQAAAEEPHPRLSRKTWRTRA